MDFPKTAVVSFGLAASMASTLGKEFSSPSWIGYSVGNGDGGGFVVDTAGFNDGFGWRSSSLAETPPEVRYGLLDRVGRLPGDRMIVEMPVRQVVRSRIWAGVNARVLFGTCLTLLLALAPGAPGASGGFTGMVWFEALERAGSTPRIERNR
jgi:hypothetical protein